ncbi:MAG TPA: glycoside hydrolase family 3 C-terminal domain-containing protein [Acidobacteriaceae bacterium]|nr:glycoside hydrolase family 3 C-terminal domain-containing protein [Acidobacteriaceae bacterium]
MTKSSRIFATFALVLTTSSMWAQNSAQPDYMNPALPAHDRAVDLVNRMTLEEKASQLVNTARAIPRLHVDAYQWWSEALHGVINQGVTEYPEPIGLAATFDQQAVHTMGHYIGVEGRIKHVQNDREHHVGIYGGLDYWAPNLNIFRDPRWGRGQETYGEDPYLTARMGVNFVEGVQGDDPRYYLGIATPKHYAVHSGPEPTRHFADVDVPKHDEVDTYEPAFRAAITEGKADSIMCAYNAINGEPACANKYLLVDQLRDKWGFQGYVVSDCDAVRDIFTGHHFRPTQAESSAISLERGMDNECYGGGPGRNNSDFQPFIEAVQKGYLSQEAMDTAVVRLMEARIKLGMFDPPDMVPYTKIDEKELDSAEHRAFARKLGNESMVLLKNDGTLPLKPSVKKVLVVGPLAPETRYLIGNYAGTPTHIVSVMEGLKAEFPNVAFTYVAGTQFLRPDGAPVPNAALTTPDGKPGLKAEYSEAPAAGGRGFGGGGGRGGPIATGPAIATRTEPNINLTGTNVPSEAAGKNVIVHYTGFITAPETADYMIGTKGTGFARFVIDGNNVVMQNGTEARTGRVHLVKGEKASLDITIGGGFGRFGGAANAAANAAPAGPHATLIWEKATDEASPDAIAAAKNADLVLAVVGITSSLEGEEMQVNLPGFQGGDRTSIDMPAGEENLVEAMVGTGKPTVVVLMNGSALAVNWINDHANAVLEAFYPGEEGGAAVAETLSGKNNPAGRLPVTFYTGVSQLPNFESYSMEGRTYRYFKGKPLYPFGYGLSYTKFAYSRLSLARSAINAGDPLVASATITNTGDREGDEVAEVYITFPDVPGAPLRALRGFKRVHLKPGESQQVEFELKDRDLMMVTTDGNPIISEGKYSISIGGGQPDTGAPAVNAAFQVNGTKPLPE